MKVCRHFIECGGCRFQDVSYPDQLKQKEKKVRDLSAFYGINAPIKPVNPSFPWYYRNKMEFTFADSGKAICGLYSKKEKGKVVEIEECLIFSADAEAILKCVKQFVVRNGYSVYNKYRHEGFLRNLIVRETKFTNEIMVGIVTSSSEELDKEGFTQALVSLKLKSPVKSVYWIVNDALSDAVVFERKELLYGDPFIEETLDGLSFRIGIDTFFQVNPRIVEGFYKKIRSYASLAPGQKVLDLFCGVGSIGIFLSKEAERVWGVELSKEIVDMARENAEKNNISNISFFVSDVRRFLNTEGEPYKNIDVLILNPPRCGLSNKIIRAVLRLSPKTILYSSCNPDALFRDIKGLSAGYTPDFVEPFDFFPHTHHLECLSLLKKK